MSKGNSRKEYLYKIFTKKYPGKIQKILGKEFESIQLERSFSSVDGNTRCVDICAIDKSGLRYFIEFSLKGIDEFHVIQLKKLIYMAKTVENTVVIACAMSISQKYLNELEQMILLNSYKNIEFMFIRLNMENLMPLLQEINKAYHLEQVPMLKRLNIEVEDHYEVIKGVRSYNNIETISAKITDSNKKYSYKQIRLIQILKRLRKDCEHANVYQYKELRSNSFMIGSSISDINYQVFFDRAGKLGIQLVFAQPNSKLIFYNLLSMKNEINDKMDYIISWEIKSQKVVSYFYERNYKDKDIMVKAICRVIRKYLFTLDSYLVQAVEEYKVIG